MDKSQQKSLLDYHFLLKTYSLLLASDHQRNFGHFKGFNDRILVMLNVRKERVVRSVASLLCILRVGDDALQEISLLVAKCLRNQKAATRVTFTHNFRVVSIGVHETSANLSEEKKELEE